MGKRLVIKTVLICIGIFIILSAAAWYFIFNTYKLDTEKNVTVLAASTKIDENTIINESMIRKKTIKASAATENMVTDISECMGSKSIGLIKEGDYIYRYNLISKSKIYADDIRAIVLPATIEDRAANLVKKGSLADIIVQPKEASGRPQVVLSKVRVDMVFDDSGINTEGSEVGSKKGFIKLLLNSNQRARIYSARLAGTLSYELYCDETQLPSKENYVIPANSNNNISDEIKNGIPQTEK